MKSQKKSILSAILFIGITLFQHSLVAQNLETKPMNLNELHTEAKAVQTQLLFTAAEGKVVSLQIAENQQLKEHISKLPAFFVCVSGAAVYEDEKGKLVALKAGDYVFIEKDVKHKVSAKEDSNFLLIR
jgi:quercetin dioxygenase-like cupin family protein